MTTGTDTYMQVAIEEARRSLREGNHGFGAVLVQDGEVVAQARDQEETAHDPTARAELLAIRKASILLGKNLESCRLYSTHEPCPMCAAAVVWAHIGYVGYGFSTRDAIGQGRTRIDLNCTELFQRAGARIQVEEGLSRGDCALLYDQDIRAEVRRLRDASDDQLKSYDRETTEKRIRWFKSLPEKDVPEETDVVRRGYDLLLKKLAITEEEAPIVRRTDEEIVVCRLSNEGATEALMRQIDRRLSFARNYEKLRPFNEYCEEILRREEDG